MKKPPTLLDAALEGEERESREAALRAAQDLGLSEDDPVWAVVRTIREGDHALIERMEKIEQQLRDTEEKMRVSEERRTMTTVGYETLEARIAAVLEDIRAMADDQWDRCHAVIEQELQMKRWLVGVVILTIALWALATPRPDEKRDSVPPAQEAMQSDE
jgi:hypothetical protein